MFRVAACKWAGDPNGRVEELSLATPVDAPKDLSRPGPTYRRHVWLAVAALLAFVSVYLALTAWFSWSAYHLLHGVISGSADGFVGAAIGLPMAFSLCSC